MLFMSSLADRVGRWVGGSVGRWVSRSVGWSVGRSVDGSLVRSEWARHSHVRSIFFNVCSHPTEALYNTLAILRRQFDCNVYYIYHSKAQNKQLQCNVFLKLFPA